MKRILVVEDETIIRKALVRLLEHSNYAVTESATVDDAIKIINDRETALDLIISDLRLPQRPGQISTAVFASFLSSK